MSADSNGIEPDHEDAHVTADSYVTAHSHVTAGVTADDADVETSLRPKSLAEFIGQPRVREQLQLVLTGAKLRGSTPDHILMSGPPGLGKTSMAMIIAQELNTSLRLTSGPALERAGDLAAMLSNLVEGDVLF
ncbi:MAG: RuvB-like domain-containing protein, partial [Rhodococcus sp. (in: high G+C Gram-positive bacteria)]